MSLIIRLCLLLMVFVLPSCGLGERKLYRIGMDQSWYPLNFSTEGVNAFIRDLFLEISQRERVDIELVVIPTEALLPALGEEVEACLTSMYPYNFNVARYDFSSLVFSLSPVLVVPLSSHYKTLKELSHKNVSTVSESPSQRILEGHPDILLQTTFSIPEALSRVVEGMDEAALVDRIPTISYVENLYNGQLKIASTLFNEEGVRLITLKGEEKSLMNLFERSLKALTKSGRLKALEMKWGLEMKSQE